MKSDLTVNSNRKAFDTLRLWIGLIAACLFLVSSLRAQMQPLPQDEGAIGLAFALRNLPVVGSFLHTTAHPDDEDNPLFVMLGKGRGLRTGLLTFTRGDGGQNEIGPELFQALGIIRTGELMSMHRYDGAEQFFTRAYEFGYSFSVEETFEKWGKEEILADAVRVIRLFRPQVIVTLPRKGTGGGQHHMASALLTAEAFRAAADPNRFPEQIREGLYPWQAKKIYERTNWGGSPSQSETDSHSIVEMETGIFDPLYGKTFFEVGMTGRTMHRCQGMSQVVPVAGPYHSSYKLVDSVIDVNPKETDLFDGVNTSLFAIEDQAAAEKNRLPELHSRLEEIQASIDRAVASFDVVYPEKTVPALSQGLESVRQLRQTVISSSLSAAVKHQIAFLLDRKEEDFLNALRLAHQVKIEAIADDGTVTPGQTFALQTTISNGSSVPLSVSNLEIRVPEGWSVNEENKGGFTIAPRSVVVRRFAVSVAADAPLTRPYWTRKDTTRDRYDVLEPESRNKHWSDAPVVAALRYDAGETEAETLQTAQFRYAGPWVGGEQRHEVMVVPLVSLRVHPEISMIPLRLAEEGREIRVTALHHGKSPVTGRIEFELPSGWSIEPSSAEISFQREGQSVTRKFHLKPPAGVSGSTVTVSAMAHFHNKTYREGHQVIDYDHIQRRLLYHPAEITVKTVDVDMPPGIQVAYVMGVGDQVPEALSQLGFNYVLLNEDDLAFEELGRFDVIMTGVRAFLNREDLRANNRRLLDWVEKGGVLIVQYNKFEFNEVGIGPDGRRLMKDSPYAPFPAQVGRGRVTDENAPVVVSNPQHPVFQSPNLITEQDWEDWVQERGLYFLGKKDERYRDLVSIRDPFPYNSGVKLGALVEAEYGRGRWIYVGLGLWRQLPAGVPGAYRILANLLSLSTSKTEHP